MNFVFKRIVGGIFVLGVVALLVGTLPGILYGTHTQYCPWRHFLWDAGVCVVLDKKGERVLVQHGQLDFNIYYLDVIEGSKFTRYKFPFSLVAQIGPRDYSANLVPGVVDHIV